MTRTDRGARDQGAVRKCARLRAQCTDARGQEAHGWRVTKFDAMASVHLAHEVSTTPLDDLTPPTDWPARTAIKPREVRPQRGYTPSLRRRSTACAPTAPSSAALGEWPSHHQICRAARAYPKQRGVSERRLGSVRDYSHRTAHAHLHVMRASRKAAARRGQHREAEEAPCFKLEIKLYPV